MIRDGFSIAGPQLDCSKLHCASCLNFHLGLKGVVICKIIQVLCRNEDIFVAVLMLDQKILQVLCRNEDIFVAVLMLDQRFEAVRVEDV